MKENNNNKEPIILGHLKKEKSSKPAFVVIVFLVVLGICFSLPYIQEYLRTSNSAIATFINSFLNKEEDTGDEVVITNDTIHTLDLNANVVYDNIVLEKVKFDGNNVSYTLKTKYDTVNLDTDTLYLEIFSSLDSLLRRVKLTGTIDTNIQARELTLFDLKFNSTKKYFGRIHRLVEADYTEITLNSDESGIGNLVCTKGGNIFSYVFDNYKLKNIVHTYKYSDIADINIYLENFNYYAQRASAINAFTNQSAIAEENDNGFEFKAYLDLNSISRAEMMEYVDYNYYDLDTMAKLINYEMKAKGYDCK